MEGKFLKTLEKIGWNLWKKFKIGEEYFLTGKSKKHACKYLCVCTKNEHKFEKFQEKFQILIKKSQWKIALFIIFTKCVLNFCLLSERIYHLQIQPFFNNNSSDFEREMLRFWRLLTLLLYHKFSIENDACSTAHWLQIYNSNRGLGWLG